MRRFLYRVYLYTITINVRFRQRLFNIWLSRRKAELARADLSYLNLSGTNLRGADLREANLRRTDLTNVDLTGADLSGADLTAALVSEEQLARAGSLTGATLPNGIIQV
jgi:uncharacterized protein YjbI with pentapeptide repeats